MEDEEADGEEEDERRKTRMEEGGRGEDKERIRRGRKRGGDDMGSG